MQESIIFLFLYEHRYLVLTSYFLFIIAAMTFYKSRIENKIFTINSEIKVNKSKNSEAKKESKSNEANQSNEKNHYGTILEEILTFLFVNSMASLELKKLILDMPVLYLESLESLSIMLI